MTDGYAFTPDELPAVARRLLDGERFVAACQAEGVDDAVAWFRALNDRDRDVVILAASDGLTAAIARGARP